MEVNSLNLGKLPGRFFFLNERPGCEANELCVSRKGGTEGSGWGHPQGTVHIMVTRPG